MKTAIVVLADPQGGEEAAGRLFNALSTAYDLKQHRQEVQILFQGAGTRWAAQVSKADHPFRALYQSVEDKVAGVSCGCADVFGARADAEANNFKLLTDNPVPGTSGLPSLAKLVGDGYSVITF